MSYIYPLIIPCYICFSYFIFYELKDSNDPQKVLAKSMISLIKQQFIKLKEIETQYVTPNFEAYKEITKLKPLAQVIYHGQSLLPHIYLFPLSLLDKNIHNSILIRI